MNDASLLLKIAAVMGVLILGVFVGSLAYRSEPVLGSIVEGQEYNATTTGAFHAQSAETLLKTGTGALGQVTITGTGAGQVSIYNATTSNITKRTGNSATSSILLAEFNGNPTVGTYTFDARFTNGLLLVVGANRPTSTITWR